MSGFSPSSLLLAAALAVPIAMLLGGLLAGGYMLKVLAPVLTDANERLMPRVPIRRSREFVVLALALCSILLGILPLRPFGLLQIGRPPTSEPRSR